MSFINICRDNTDPFYRYKMPPIQLKIEGRGNGIKTVVVNAAEVARALNRPPIYVLKYLGLELGAQATVVGDERYVVNGVHDAAKLQDVLDGFISKFVLCLLCKNPETEIVVTKDGNLERDCKACGTVSSIDPRSKLATYILKHPPALKGKKLKKLATATANMVGGGKTILDIAGSTAQEGEGNEAAPEGDDDDYLTRKINAEAKNLAPAAEVADDDWAVDMLEEAIRARAAELEALLLEGTNSKAEAYNTFGEWLLAAEDKDDLPLDVEIYKKASELLIVEDPETVQVLVQALFDEDVALQIKAHAGLLTKLTTSESHQKALLGGLERWLGLDKPELIPAVPKILMVLYETDLVEEEVIQEWGSRVLKKYVPKDVLKKVRKAAKPFLQWLEQAEEESD